MTHELKTWPEFFSAADDGSKTFELRYDDRLFRVGDLLFLREWQPSNKTYTGRTLKKRVTYVLRGFGLQPGWVAMACENANELISAGGKWSDPARVRFLRRERGIVLRLPGWDEQGRRADSEWSISDDTARRLAAELTAAGGDERP